MFIDKKKRLWPKVLAVLAAVFLLAGLWFWVSSTQAENMAENGAAAIRDVVERSALQCYVVEGAYPSSLEYLEEKYMGQINTEDYYITYDVFASNVPPSVRVVRRTEQ